MFCTHTKSKLLNTMPRKLFFIQAAFGTAFTYLTSGVFLSGLAIFMGAGDVLLSYLSVIVNICGVLILAFSAFLQRFRSQKKLTICLTILSRLATLFIVVIPLIAPPKYQLILFVIAVVIAFALQAQSTVVLNQWMLGFIDEKKSGQYISLRQTLTLIITVVLSVSGGYWMDFVNGKLIGFIILFAVAAVAAAADIVLLSRISDNIAYHPPVQEYKLHELIKLPMQDKKFTSFVFYIFAFYMLLNISDSFTIVYMMKYLELPYRTVTAICLIISLPQVVLLGVWGKISDKYGHDFALKASVWLFAGQTLFMSFASPKDCYLFIPVAFFIASVANAGFVVAVFNTRYKIMPKENRIVYDNFYTATIGLGFILGPLLGGIFKGLLESSTVLSNPEVSSALPFANIRLLYIFSTLGILILQVAYVKKEKN